MVITTRPVTSSKQAFIVDVPLNSPGLLGSAVDAVRGSREQRMNELLDRMKDADADPEGFSEFLNEKLATNHEDTIVALRLLLNASIDSVALGAIEPIAFVGRSYVRGDCVAWIARGWMRLLSELTDLELRDLREFISISRIARRRRRTLPVRMRSNGSWIPPSGDPLRTPS